MMSEQETTDVLIVGAGPVGLTTAALLEKRGMRVLVVERASTIDMAPKASTIHGPTLELLETLDVTDHLIERGLVANSYQHRDRQRGIVAEFDFSVLKDDTKYPFRLQCEQQRLSEALLERMATRERVTIAFDTELVSFIDTGGGVVATLKGPDGERTVGCRFLLGTDGASSTVRGQLGIEFEGSTYVDRYLVYLTDHAFENDITDLCLVNYISDPEQFVVLLRAPASWRVLFRTDETMTDERANDPALIEQLLQGVVAKPEPYGILHTQLYRIHQRVAVEFRQGNAMLLGDAAHINSPIGGMGMNNGIHDAFDLARVLPGVMVGDLPDTAIDEWALRRRTVAREFVRVITDRNAKALAEKDESSRLAHQQELAAIASDPARCREWLLSSSMINAVNEQGLLPYR
jgi:3-(3-hydroxy-phenyl)propionate hydroxylase